MDASTAFRTQWGYPDLMTTTVKDFEPSSTPVEAAEYALMGGGEGRVALIPAGPREGRGARQAFAEM